MGLVSLYLLVRQTVGSYWSNQLSIIPTIYKYNYFPIGRNPIMPAVDLFIVYSFHFVGGPNAKLHPMGHHDFKHTYWSTFYSIIHKLFAGSTSWTSDRTVTLCCPDTKRVDFSLLLRLSNSNELSNSFLLHLHTLISNK